VALPAVLHMTMPSTWQITQLHLAAAVLVVVLAAA
jgi:hypothetical protein